ncbi:MAG: metallophosphoesterase family protein [Subdoligranulum sp.]
MKILAVADEESKYLWEYYEPSKLRDIDLIIGCGDLSRHYMNFLSDAAPVPVLYVHGNHDASYDREPPRGAICIDDDLYWYKGYRIVGLGGSCRYRAGAWQFTEAEMKRRISHLRSRDPARGRGGYPCYPCAAARLWGFQRPAAPRVYGVQ